MIYDVSEVIMTDEIKNERIIYLYRITCLVNQKIYIGQTVDPTSRWRGHRRDSAEPKVPIQFALKKYGAHNFEFEVIASCKTQDNANELETELVKQYNSYISNGLGYNATHGGYNAPKSEAWVQSMKNWHASLSPEERAEISKKQAEATIKQIKDKGHPGQGTKRTEEQRANISTALKALDKSKIYTDEVRKNMSEAHIGIKDSEKTKQKKAEKAKLAWEKRQQEAISNGELKCNAPGCEVNGVATYLIVNDIRYCGKHGQRLKNTGALELQHKPAHNRIHLTNEQISSILLDKRSNIAIAKDFGASAEFIRRLKKSRNQ